ncbi:MAG: type I restriction enzyme HsdR N-terminal domain-containing protein [Bacteroidota bacterium]
MLSLNLPLYEFSISNETPARIFDPIRKKFVALTLEEWVRQNFLQFLITQKKYPAELLLIEKTLTVHKMKKRCDAVVYNNLGEPLVILEFKNPDIPINQKVFDQIARYNIALRVKYLIVSNGLSHYCCAIDFENNSFKYLEQIPEYNFL